VADQGRVSIGWTGDGALNIRLGGDWSISGDPPEAADVDEHLTTTPAPGRMVYDATALGDWDSSLLVFVARVGDLAGERGIAVDRSGLPQGVQQLLRIAEAVPEKRDTRVEEPKRTTVYRIGRTALSAASATGRFVDFLGEVTASLGRLLRGSAQFRPQDLGVEIQKAGANALGIVSLVSFLLGLILAFVGAIQLRQFGASIYVADLVSIAMVHDMGALMTAIVMSGRSGAAYAAELGSMKVNQETDALTTLGISSIDFLVLPRVLALVLMMPLLTLYSDLMGIVGGLLVGTGMLGLSAQTYVQQSMQALSMSDLLGGLSKAVVYGMLVGLAGCMRGMQSSRSAAGVGDATTSAVVTAIVAIISAAGVFAVVFYALGI
jgi:phospholipid/cholesterol/gamma-HCH transport system permease protein